MRKYDYYWQSNENWYHMTENYEFVVNEDAPPEAQKSYQHYLEQCKEVDKRVTAGESYD